MTQTSTQPRIGSRTRYVGLWALGTAIYVGALVAGYPLVAVAGFAVCGIGAVASLRTSDRVVFDERDREPPVGSGEDLYPLIRERWLGTKSAGGAGSRA